MEAESSRLRLESDGATPRHLVYIDDEEGLASLVAQFLGRKGIRVTTYSDPVKALEQIGRSGPDIHLVVTDYQMPGLDGLQVAQRLRDARPEIPVAIATGSAHESVRRRALALGAVAYYAKPTAIEDLVQAIEATLATLPF